MKTVLGWSERTLHSESQRRGVFRFLHFRFLPLRFLHFFFFPT